jgi:hypothetical protein
VTAPKSTIRLTEVVDMVNACAKAEETKGGLVVLLLTELEILADLAGE